MLKGDLATTPLPEVLRALAEPASTGCLRVRTGAERTSGGEARVFLRKGKVYAVVLPDRRPELGLRLVSSGDLDPAALAEAYDAQRTELQGWRLGELLVHLGYVEQSVVEHAVGEQLREAAFELTLWTAGGWRFRPDERAREDVAPAVDVDTLLADLAAYAADWETLRPRVHGPDAVPVLSAAGTSPDTLSLDGDAWSLLCTVDGTSSLSQLAASSGLSLLEAAQVVVTLVDAGLVEIEPAAAEPAAAEPTAAEPTAAGPAAAEPAPEPLCDAEVVEPVAAPAAEAPRRAVVADVEEPELPPAAPVAIASRLAEALRGLGPMPVLAPYPLDPPVEPAAASQPLVAAEPEPEPQPTPQSAAASAQPTDHGLSSTALEGEALSRSLAPSVDDLSVAGSISRASESLAVTLGDTTEQFDPFAVGTGALAPPPVAPLDEREARRRARDAQELAERHAALMAERAAEREHDMHLARLAMAEFAHDVIAHDVIAHDVIAGDAAAGDDGDVPAPPDTSVEADGTALPSEDDQRTAAEMQAAAFAELTQAASAVAPAAEPAVVADVQPQAEPVAVHDDGLGRDGEPPSSPSAPPRDADTAALLRELSSLGLENDPEPVPQQRTAPPPAVRPLASVGAKKRKGLFGRG